MNRINRLMKRKGITWEEKYILTSCKAAKGHESSVNAIVTEIENRLAATKALHLAVRRMNMHIKRITT